MRHQGASALAIGMGVVAGLRPMTALAILSVSLRRGWIRPGHSYARIVSDSASKRIAEFALSELISDKLPFARSRLDAGPLTWRIVSGAICGAAVHGSRKKPIIVEGAVLGGLGSLAGSVTGHYVRQRLGREMPDLVIALLEDALALGAGASIVALASAAK